MRATAKKGLFYLAIVGLLSTQSLFAQETETATDTVASAIESIQSDLSILKKIKFSGYIQAQWQKADTIGSPAGFSGGNFSGLDNRFAVRRGRLKVAYTNELSNYVLQIDATEKGLGLKDAYVQFTDPWLTFATVTGGVFNRPFGYEVEYSSASLESPERSRVCQTLFPGEEDLGAKLTLQMPKTSNWSFIKLDAGLFNGNGINVETDKYKDFIGHLSAKKTYFNESLSVGLGASYYNGGWAAGTDNVYKMDKATNSYVADASKKTGDKLKREYFGLDGQVSFVTPLGITTLRSEYILGTQPGTTKTSGSPTGIWNNDASTVYTTAAVTDATTGKITYTTTAKTVTTPMDAYVREFNGGYVYFIQSILDTKTELVVKYDWLDPNTKISGNQIGVANSKTGAADIKYSTLGLGCNYYWNSNVKITAYYELVSNEKTNATTLANSNSGVKSFGINQKDNVFTLRLQYKF